LIGPPGASGQSIEHVMRCVLPHKKGIDMTNGERIAVEAVIDAIKRLAEVATQDVIIRDIGIPCFVHVSAAPDSPAIEPRMMTYGGKAIDGDEVFVPSYLEV
jgi:hypothetical protein